MNNSKTIENYPVLMNYIGTCSDDSRLDADLEGLKDILPGLVKVRAYCGDDDRDDMDAAIQCIGFTIANLKELRKELLN